MTNEQIFSINNLKRMFNYSADIEIKVDQCQERPAIFVYCRPLTDASLIASLQLPSMDTANSIYQTLQLEVRKKDSIDKETMEEAIFSGRLMVIPEEDSIYFYDISKTPTRQPDESVAEVSIRGAKDGFVEDITINLGLIRKRLRTSSLIVENYSIGKRTNTRVALL
ncbi:MAG TPA: spore germination protein, partial [Pseudoneobacillus sp.]|nr:spore germination protein [Pseudoneobacillus sp.]